MTECVYPILPDDKMNFMMDKQKALREKLAHYKKIKNKWSCANTALKITGIFFVMYTMWSFDTYYDAF